MHQCEKCRFKAQYEKNPVSWIGRFWHWHIRWCPGWKRYYASQTVEEKARLTARYNLPN